MRLHNLFESEELSEDIVEFEFGDDFVIEASMTFPHSIQKNSLLPSQVRTSNDRMVDQH